MSGLILTPRHIARIFEKWLEKSKDVSHAIALGVPHTAVMVAVVPLPAGDSGAEYVGSLCGSPSELVK